MREVWERGSDGMLSVLDGVMSYTISVDEHLNCYESRQEYLTNTGMGIAVPSNIDNWTHLVELQVYERTPVCFVHFFGPSIHSVLCEYANYTKENM